MLQMRHAFHLKDFYCINKKDKAHILEEILDYSILFASHSTDQDKIFIGKK